MTAKTVPFTTKALEALRDNIEELETPGLYLGAEGEQVAVLSLDGDRFTIEILDSDFSGNPTAFAAGVNYTLAEVL